MDVLSSSVIIKGDFINIVKTLEFLKDLGMVFALNK